MPGAIETRLAALHALLVGAAPGDVLRSEVLPVRVPVEGIAIMEDGRPGEPEVLFPLSYHFDHQVPVSLYVQAHADRQVITDTWKAAIGAAIAGDRTLGGLCDWVDAELVDNDDLPGEGADSLRLDQLVITLSYGVSNPLT